jgi:hypothetical protein
MALVFNFHCSVERRDFLNKHRNPVPINGKKKSSGEATEIESAAVDFSKIIISYMRALRKPSFPM